MTAQTPTLGPLPCNVALTANPDGSYTVTAKQMFLDGTTAPLTATLTAAQVEAMTALIYKLVKNAAYADPTNSVPQPADVARIVACFYNIINSPSPAVAPPAPVSVPVPPLT